MRVQMAVVMAAFCVGLFAGGGKLRGLPLDNLDLERWFRLPKGHERRINGRRHAGVRLVQEGATLMPVLDANREDAVFTAEQLLDYRRGKQWAQVAAGRQKTACAGGERCVDRNVRDSGAWKAVATSPQGRVLVVTGPRPRSITRVL